MEMKTLMKKYRTMPVAAKASFWSFFCNALQKGIVFFTVPIITRMLSTSDYGRYSIFTTYANILMIFGTLSLYANGYFVGMKRYGREKNRFTASMAGLMILLTTLCLMLIMAIQSQVTDLTGLNRMSCLLLFAWVYGQGATDLWLQENRYAFKYRMVAVCTIITAISTPILKILFIRFFRWSGGDEALGAILGYVLPVAAVGLVAWITMFLRSSSFFVKEYWGFALKFNIPLIPYFLSQTILNQADRIMIERLDSVSAAGIYSVAYSAATAIMIVSSAVDNSFTPWQYQCMQRGEHKRAAKMMNLLMLIITAVYILPTFVAPELMKIFAAPEYAEAVYVIPPVTIGLLLSWLTRIFINFEFYYEMNIPIALSSVLSALLNVVLNVFAISRYGYLAAAYTTLICYLANMIFHCVMAVGIARKKKVPQTFDLEKIALLVVGCIGGMFVIMSLYRSVWIRYGLLVMACVVAYLKRAELTSFLKNLWISIRT